MSPDGIAAFVVIFSRSLELVRKDKELLRLCLGVGGKINDTSVLIMTCCFVVSECVVENVVRVESTASFRVLGSW